LNLQIGLFISVKFRAFGITFGSFSRTLTLGVDVTTGKLVFSDGGPNTTPGVSTSGSPSGLATTLLNERGVLVQAWI
jgi:hypothetical protein